MPTRKPGFDPSEPRPWLRAVAPQALVTLLVCALAVSVNLRGEYVLLALFWGFITFAGPRSRRFANMALPFLMVGIIYDQILPHLFQYRPEPHVADLYHLEQRLFGIHTAAGTVIPSEWLQQHTSPVLDIATGFGYMMYMFESFLVAAWMFFIDEEQTNKLAWAFLLVNILGFTSWIVFPAAPPWYVAQYGLGPAHMDALPSAAGAARFDQILGITFFSGFYQRSHNVYGAMPSLHVAYPLVVAISAFGMRRRWLNVLCIAFFVLVTFSAVYLEHHYVIDAIMGAVFALVAYGLMLWLRTAYLRWRATNLERIPAAVVVR